MNYIKIDTIHNEEVIINLSEISYIEKGHGESSPFVRIHSKRDGVFWDVASFIYQWKNILEGEPISYGNMNTLHYRDDE